MLFTIRNVAAALIITLLLAGAAQAWGHGGHGWCYWHPYACRGR